MEVCTIMVLHGADDEGATECGNDVEVVAMNSTDHSCEVTPCLKVDPMDASELDLQVSVVIDR